MKDKTARSIQTGNVPTVVAGLPIVNVWRGGQSIGLYHVKQIDERAIVLNPGSITFAIGTLLEVVDFQRLIPDSAGRRLSTTVVDTGGNGIQLAW